MRSRRATLLGRRNVIPVLRGRAGAATATTTITVAQGDFNTAPAAGDLLVAFCSTATPDGSDAFNTPSGWDLLGAAAGGSAIFGGVSVFARRATDAEGSYVFDTSGATQSCTAHVYAYANAFIAGFYGLSTTAGDTLQPLPACSTPSPRGIAVGHFSAAYGSAGAVSISGPAGFTQDLSETGSQAAVVCTSVAVRRSVTLAGGVIAGNSLACFIDRASPAYTTAVAVLLKGP